MNSGLGMMSRKPVGWKNESARHSLAARGFRTVNGRFVYKPRYSGSVLLFEYGNLKPDGKYHLIKKRIWHRDVRKGGCKVVVPPFFDDDFGYIGFLTPYKKKWKVFKKKFYNKKNPEHGFGYIIDPEKNRIRAMQIIDIEDDIFDKYHSGGFIDSYVDQMRRENPEHKVVTREVDIPISRLSRENPSNYFFREAFDEKRNLSEHVTTFMDEHTGPKMRYVEVRSYKNRDDAYRDWKGRNEEVDKGTLVTGSEYTRWLRRHQNLL